MSKERIQGHRSCLSQGKSFVMFGAGTCLEDSGWPSPGVFRSLSALTLNALRNLSLAGQTWTEDRVAFLLVGSTGWEGWKQTSASLLDQSLVLFILALGLKAALHSLRRDLLPSSPSVGPQA